MNVLIGASVLTTLVFSSLVIGSDVDGRRENSAKSQYSLPPTNQSVYGDAHSADESVLSGNDNEPCVWDANEDLGSPDVDRGRAERSHAGSWQNRHRHNGRRVLKQLKPQKKRPVSDDNECVTAGPAQDVILRRKFNFTGSVKVDFFHVIFIFLEPATLFKGQSTVLTCQLRRISAEIERALKSADFGTSSVFPNRYSVLEFSYSDTKQGRAIPVGETVCGTAKNLSDALKELAESRSTETTFQSIPVIDGYWAITLALALARQCGITMDGNARSIVLLISRESRRHVDLDLMVGQSLAVSYKSTLSALQASDTILNFVRIEDSITGRDDSPPSRKNSAAPANETRRIEGIGLRNQSYQGAKSTTLDLDDYASLSLATGGRNFVLFGKNKTFGSRSSTILHRSPSITDLPSALAWQGGKERLGPVCEICYCRNRSLHCSKLLRIIDESSCLSRSPAKDGNTQKDSKWTPWFALSDCSASCNGQGQIRYARLRYCSECCKTNKSLFSNFTQFLAADNSPRPYGKCIEWEEQLVGCSGNPCPVGGKWSAWTELSSCNASCGGLGYVELVRYCNNPPPMFGGSLCRGRRSKLKMCVKPPCSLCHLLPLPNGNLSVNSINGSRAKRGISSFIIGGQKAKKRSWPWIAMIYNRHDAVAVCGGALIHRRFVLTAAHCLTPFIREDRRVPRTITIKLGKRFFGQGEGRQVQKFRVLRAVVHPKYKEKSLRNDIALLYLSKAARLSKRVKVLRIPNGRQVNSTDLCLERPGTLVRLAGWGQVDERMINSPTLQEVTLPVTDQKVCQKAFAGDNNVTAKMICVGYGDGERDACRGDSGGPVVAQHPMTKKWVLLGLVSWGSDRQGCAQRNRYTVATRVSRYYKWVTTVISRHT